MKFLLNLSISGDFVSQKGLTEDYSGLTVTAFGDMQQYQTKILCLDHYLNCGLTQLRHQDPRGKNFVVMAGTWKPFERCDRSRSYHWDTQG